MKNGKSRPSMDAHLPPAQVDGAPVPADRHIKAVLVNPTDEIVLCLRFGVWSLGLQVFPLNHIDALAT
jgi:hypothetical protein